MLFTREGICHGHKLPNIVEVDGRIGSSNSNRGKVKSKGDSTARSFDHVLTLSSWEV